jgi:hypothetical protein
MSDRNAAPRRLLSLWLAFACLLSRVCGSLCPREYREPDLNDEERAYLNGWGKGEKW